MSETSWNWESADRTMSREDPMGKYGGWVSTTFTLKLHKFTFCAVQVTVLSPTGSRWPLDGEQVAVPVSPVQTFWNCTGGYVTVAPSFTHSSSRSAGHVPCR